MNIKWNEGKLGPKEVNSDLFLEEKRDKPLQAVSEALFLRMAKRGSSETAWTTSLWP